ncbi:DUF5664 domain-containing protein [Balamuthia mandrillaris]
MEGKELPTAGEFLFALNPKYKDGTRLRKLPADNSPFNGVWLPNDTQVEVLEGTPEFALVKKPDGQQGWIRLRNLTRTRRVAGVTKDVVTTEMVTPDPEYVKGIKIYNLGIKEDPVPGQKFGKGLQHLISSQWMTAMSEFVGSHFRQLQGMAQHAYEGSKRHPQPQGAGYDFIYFVNLANHLFNRADVLGLASQEAIDFFLMACWLVMAAAEVDDFPFSKYTKAQRQAQREDFYRMYLEPLPGPGVVTDVPRDDASVLGKFAAPVTRRDLLPPIALERLGINNELSALKYADPEIPLREGFRISQRIDSLKRHFEGVHRRLTDEDHIIHLLWNFHAIYHVLVVFPDKNDLIDYSAVIERGRVKVPPARYLPTTSLDKIARGGLPPTQVLKLDWNEGAIPPPRSVTEALMNFVQAAEGTFLKWYPHLAGGEELRRQLARYCGGIIEESLLITNGSDDALILLCHSLLGPGNVVLAPVPTYDHFCVNAVGAGATLVRWEAAEHNRDKDPFVADADALSEAIEQHNPCLVYLVSPNNPTGVMWSPKTVRGLAERYPRTTFLVDEAYYEFSSPDPDAPQQLEANNEKAKQKEEAGEDKKSKQEEKPLSCPPFMMTCAKLATTMTNVIVTRTFSKAFCLASVRCGYMVGHPTTIDGLRAYYNPKSVNSFAQVAASQALKEWESYYLPYIKATNAAREAFLHDLQKRGVPARSGGGGNFVCVGPVPGGRTAELCQRLEKESIYVRDISNRFPGFVRITIGLDMSRVVDTLAECYATFVKEI